MAPSARPTRLREFGLPSRLGGVDAGNLPVRVRGNDRDPVTGIIDSYQVIANALVVREAVRERVVAGERVFLAGGCCANGEGSPWPFVRVIVHVAMWNSKSC
ncbi:MAG: hypothetical protein WEE66_03790 [Actinomycetota bacterium]